MMLLQDHLPIPFGSNMAKLEAMDHPEMGDLERTTSTMPYHLKKKKVTMLLVLSTTAGEQHMTFLTGPSFSGHLSLCNRGRLLHPNAVQMRLGMKMDA